MCQGKAAFTHYLQNITIFKLHPLFLTFSGSTPCMVDYHVLPWFERMPAIQNLSDYNVLPPDKYPRLARWYKDIQKVPAVKETMLPTEWHMLFMTSLFMKDPQYDIGLEDANLSKL